MMSSANIMMSSANIMMSSANIMMNHTATADDKVEQNMPLPEGTRDILGLTSN